MEPYQTLMLGASNCKQICYSLKYRYCQLSTVEESTVTNLFLHQTQIFKGISRVIVMLNTNTLLQCKGKFTNKRFHKHFVRHPVRTNRLASYLNCYLRIAKLLKQRDITECILICNLARLPHTVCSCRNAVSFRMRDMQNLFHVVYKQVKKIFSEQGVLKLGVSHENLVKFLYLRFFGEEPRGRVKPSFLVYQYILSQDGVHLTSTGSLAFVVLVRMLCQRSHGDSAEKWRSDKWISKQVIDSAQGFDFN